MRDRRRVLVVEDDPDTRRMVAGLLADEGYDPQIALDGDHALRSALALTPDLIILDVHVPEPSFAVHFVERYRERVAPDRRAPIIALSAHEDLESFAEQVGASAHVRKPFDVESLLVVVRDQLSRRVGDTEVAGRG